MSKQASGAKAVKVNSPKTNKNLHYLLFHLSYCVFCFPISRCMAGFMHFMITNRRFR